LRAQTEDSANVMPKKKEPQVFDQSDLDSLMAEIQQGDADSDEDAPSDGTQGASSVVAEADKIDTSQDLPQDDDADGVQADEKASEPKSKGLEQKDLDGLIEAIQNNPESQDKSPESDPDNQGADDGPAPDDQPSPEAPPPGQGNETAVAPAPDGADEKTIDQSELEALIKELQEGVEAPEIERLQESAENSTLSAAQADVPPEPRSDNTDDDPEAAASEKPTSAARDIAAGLAPAEKQPSQPQEERQPSAKSSANPKPNGNKAARDSSKALSDPCEVTSDDDQQQQGQDTQQVSEQVANRTNRPAKHSASQARVAARFQAHPRSKRYRLMAGLLVAILLISGGSGVLIIKARSNHSTVTVAEPAGLPTSLPLAEASVTKVGATVVAEEVSASAIDRVALINAKLEETGALRDELLTKQDEVLALKQHYQEGIVLIQKEILAEQQKHGIKSYPRAIKNNRIALGLQTIQRRMAYMEQLDKPLAWLRNASEELLFINRAVTIEMRMLSTVSGIDLEALERQILQAIDNYQPSVGHLAINHSSTGLPPLKRIWDELIQPARPQSKPVDSARVQTDGRNQTIWKEICQGNYRHRTELTALSPEAAKCLAQAKESDLFLNGISNLTSEAAKYLFQWEGNWICLNGLSQVSSETARYLFKWNGNWLSLNGLQGLRGEAARYLVQWPGKQLELMGLSFKGQPHELQLLTYLAQWKQAGGKLYVPDNIEKQIAKLME